MELDTPNTLYRSELFMSIEFEKLTSTADREILVEFINEILVELDRLVEEVKAIRAENHNSSNQMHSDWLSLKDAAKYAGVSYNTFITFRHMGLKVCEIEGIKRVSRKEIDNFLESHSY